LDIQSDYIYFWDIQSDYIYFWVSKAIILYNSSVVEDIKEVIYHYTRILNVNRKCEVWIVTDSCGCNSQFSLNCETHIPRTEIERATAAYCNLFTWSDPLGTNSWKLALNTVNESIVDTDHPDADTLSEASFGLLFMRPPGMLQWYLESCKKLSQDPNVTLSPQQLLRDVSELSWQDLLNEMRFETSVVDPQIGKYTTNQLIQEIETRMVRFNITPTVKERFKNHEDVAKWLNTIQCLNDPTAWSTMIAEL